MDKELLVIASHAAAQELGARFQVVATLGPRLLVLRAGADAQAGIAALAGVQAVVADARDVAALQGLDENERLFADAWAARGRKSGPRAGDGQDWDAPGFEPPGH